MNGRQADARLLLPSAPEDYAEGILDALRVGYDVVDEGAIDTPLSLVYDHHRLIWFERAGIHGVMSIRRLNAEWREIRLAGSELFVVVDEQPLDRPNLRIARS